MQHDTKENLNNIRNIICFLIEFKKLILKSIWKYKGPEITNTILQKQTNKQINKKNKIGGIILSDFKTCKATVIETVCFWCKERYIDNDK